MEYKTLEDHIGYWLRLVSNGVHYSFRRSLEETYDIGIPEWVALRCLADVEKYSLNELQSVVGTDKGALSRVIEKLRKKGLVVRSGSSKDRRAVDIRITAKGKNLIPGLVNLANENERKYFSSLKAEEKKKLVQILKHLSIKNNIKNKPIN